MCRLACLLSDDHRNTHGNRRHGALRINYSNRGSNPYQTTHPMNKHKAAEPLDCYISTVARERAFSVVYSKLTAGIWNECSKFLFAGLRAIGEDELRKQIYDVPFYLRSNNR